MKNFGIGLLGMVGIAWIVIGICTAIYALGAGLGGVSGNGDSEFSWNWFTWTGTAFWVALGVWGFVLLTYSLGKWMREI